MAEFTVIETQEQLDAVIGDRIKRERETLAKKYEGWKSPKDMEGITAAHAEELKKAQDALAEAERKSAEKDTQIAEGAKYKTDLAKTRIALAAGLKMEYADRLRGETAEEWETDAKILAKDFAAAHRTAPIGGSEPTPAKNEKTRKLTDHQEAFRDMLSQMDDGK